MYYPFTTVSGLNAEEKLLANEVVQHTEKMRLVSDGSDLVLRVASDIQHKLHDNRHQFVHVIQNMCKKLNDLDNRVASLEDWSGRAKSNFR